MPRKFSRVRARNRAEEEVGVDLTPMLDMVFILLIFFIVTSSYAQTQVIHIERPEAQYSNHLVEDEPIFLQINSEGDLLIDNEPIIRTQLKSLLEKRIEQAPQTPVVIDADRKTTADTLVEIMDAAKAAGASQLSLATDGIR